MAFILLPTGLLRQAALAEAVSPVQRSSGADPLLDHSQRLERHSARKIARVFNTHNTTVYRVVRTFRDAEKLRSRTAGRIMAATKLCADYLGLLDRLVRPNPEHGWRRPTSTRELLVKTMLRKTGVRVHVATISGPCPRSGAAGQSPSPRPLPLGSPRPRRLHVLHRLLASLPRQEVAATRMKWTPSQSQDRPGLDGAGADKEAWTPGQNESVTWLEPKTCVRV